jgi:hypothetical protein
LEKKKIFPPVFLWTSDRSNEIYLMINLTFSNGWLNWNISNLIPQIHNSNVADYCTNLYLLFLSLGYSWDELSPCINWMSSFVFALRESQNASSTLAPAKSMPNVSAEEVHNIQVNNLSTMSFYWRFIGRKQIKDKENFVFQATLRGNTWYLCQKLRI